MIILHIINIPPVDESESKELRHYIPQKPDPAEAPLLPDLLRYQTLAVFYIYGCAFDALHLRSKQRLQNLGMMLIKIDNGINFAVCIRGMSDEY